MAVPLYCSVGERDYIDHEIWTMLEIFCFQRLQQDDFTCIGFLKTLKLKNAHPILYSKTVDEGRRGSPVRPPGDPGASLIGSANFSPSLGFW